MKRLRSVWWVQNSCAQSSWFVRNSWGPNFVSNGYIWIRKDCGGSGPYGMYTTRPTTPIYPAND